MELASELPPTFAVTLGPFFFSSADEPFGKARKMSDPTITVTATRNFILLSHSLTINKKKVSSPRGRPVSSATFIWAGRGEGMWYPGVGTATTAARGSGLRRLLRHSGNGRHGRKHAGETHGALIGSRSCAFQPIRSRRVTPFCQRSNASSNIIIFK